MQSASVQTAPVIWLVLGDKKGDNGQVETIATGLEHMLGWRSELKHIQMLEPFVFGKARVGPSLYHIDRGESSPLEAPWPDLVLTVGRSPANVALWIRQQSGGHSKIVLFGKPSGLMDQFDLIITSTETLIPPYKNVQQILMPLMQINQTAVEAAGREWQSRFSQFPRPVVGIMVGGPTNPFKYDAAVVNQLIEAAERVSKAGGTAYFTTSRRTPASVVQALKARLPQGAQWFEWNSNATDNPYLALLALADRFVVTGDSISMMVEVLRLEKALEILPLSCGFLGTLDQWRRGIARWLYRPNGGSSADRLRMWLVGLVYRSRFIQHTRHYPGFHQMLVDRGLAIYAGQGGDPSGGSIPDDVSTVVQRIQRMVG